MLFIEKHKILFIILRIFSDVCFFITINYPSLKIKEISIFLSINEQLKIANEFKFRDMQSRKLTSTEFHSNKITFCIYCPHITFAIINFGIFWLDSYSATIKTSKYRVQIRNQKHQNASSMRFQVK